MTKAEIRAMAQAGSTLEQILAVATEESVDQALSPGLTWDGDTWDLSQIDL